ncbi:unnamed protein product [Mycena citricolor]|uniref:HPt domain-containing protein n=1 Tax=Mycena citricolor TaxID=2018698 RepID=A0AAD2H7J0_9AGAR|nr:unnamed protein product [Mycena citricolor]CAK5284345.1 unnamed protein product [Mycena citricolor]
MTGDAPPPKASASPTRTSTDSAPSDPAPPAESDSKDDAASLPVPEAIDMEAFSQILELDEEGSHDFSKEMVTAYFSQATTTFVDMDKALADENLPELSSLGHFLKGSSAALGIHHVQASCEKMQHYGELRDEIAGIDLKSDEALARIRVLLPATKAEYADARRWLKKWYDDQSDPLTDVDDDDDDDDKGKPETKAP